MSFFEEEEFNEIASKVVEPLCDQCGLLHGAKTKRMEVSGKGRKKALIIGEGPGPDEDEQGTQWVGKVGQALESSLLNRDFDLHKDFWKINAVNCIPKDTGAKENFRSPKDYEIASCRPYVHQIIKELSPEFILLMGSAAIESFIGQSFSDHRVATWRGYCIPDAYTGAYVLPLYHPSALLHAEKDEHLRSVYYRDLDNAIDKLRGNNLPAHIKPDFRKKIKVLQNYDEITNVLDFYLNKPPECLFFDYEATGLKPYAPGHKIVSISFSTKPNQAYSFPYMYRDHFTLQEQAQIRKRWKKLLIHPKTHKIAQNAPFEYIWTENQFNLEIEDFIHCTMIGTHVLDTRPGITSLDFQCYKNFGITPYGEEIRQFLIAPTANSFNNIEKAPLDKLLLYGGEDSYHGMNLYMQQMKEFNKRSPDLKPAYDFYLEGAIELARMQVNGIPVSEQYYQDKEEEIREQIEVYKENFFNLPILEEFENKYGRRFDLSSDVDKRTLFYTLGGAEKVTTATGLLSVSKKALASIEGEEHVKLYQQIKRMEKVIDTYIAGIKREVVDETIRPFISLGLVRTLRSSSSDPNFQNVPEHDIESKQACKSGVVPSKGNWLLAWDFKGIEVSTGCFYHFDRSMIQYITDPTTDMHRDAACDICILPPEEVTKDIRFHFGKNGWVFPQFYGDYYGNLVPQMWRQVRILKTVSGILLKDHLIDKLNTNANNVYDAFVEHCKNIEYKFWQERFGTYKQWREDICEDYIRDGFIKTLFGFEMGGVLSKNDCANHGIQGTAFHLLLWTLIQFGKYKRMHTNWKSKSIFQIHDSGLEDLVPKELNEIVAIIWKIGTQELRKTFSWINVPMSIEFEISKNNWAQAETIGKDDLKDILKTQGVSYALP